MDAYISWFIHGLLLVPVTLLPIINPLSSAPVLAATVGTNHAMAQRLARQGAINSWFVLVTSMLIGTYVLALFGISLTVVRSGARQDRYVGDDSDDGFHPALHRYPDHVDRLGRVERDRDLTRAWTEMCPGKTSVQFKAVLI